MSELLSNTPWNLLSRVWSPWFVKNRLEVGLVTGGWDRAGGLARSTGGAVPWSRMVRVCRCAIGLSASIYAKMHGVAARNCGLALGFAVSFGNGRDGTLLRRGYGGLRRGTAVPNSKWQMADGKKRIANPPLSRALRRTDRKLR